MGESGIMAQIIGFTVFVFFYPLKWDFITFTLFDFCKFSIQVFVLFFFLWQILLNFFRKKGD